MRILIVDDHALTREAFGLALRRRAEVDFATGIAEAYALLDGGAYDLYLVDEVLPDGSGAALLRRVRELGLGGWRVLMSGFGEPVGFEGGVYDCFVQKPNDVEALLDRIRTQIKAPPADRRGCE